MFPQTFVLQGLEQRVVRVGFTGTVQPVEQAYRIVVNQLPGFNEATGRGMGLTIRTAFSIPLFVSNVDVHAATSLGAVTARSHDVAFDVQNGGNTHVIVGAVHVRGQDGAGNALFDRTLNGWYVLPNQTRRFDVPLTTAACRRLENVTIDVSVDGANRPLHAAERPIFIQTCGIVEADAQRAFLDVTVNAVDRGEVVASIAPSGDVLLSRAEVQRLGIPLLAPPHAVTKGDVSLRSLAPGVAFSLDLLALRLLITVDPRMLPRQAIAIGAGSLPNDVIADHPKVPSPTTTARSRAFRDRPRSSKPATVTAKSCSIRAPFSISAARRRAV